MLPQVANIAVNRRITLNRPKPDATIALSKSAGASTAVISPLPSASVPVSGIVE